MKFNNYINESSLLRLYKHMQKHDAGTITAFRDIERNDNGDVVKTYTKKENKARNKILLAKLMKKYSVTKVKRTYIENYGSTYAKEVGESVFFVVDNKDHGTLEKDLKTLGKEFNQDSIMFIPMGIPKGVLWGTKNDEYSDKYAYPSFNKTVTFKNAVWGKKAEFMTKINNRPFVLKENLVEIYKDKGYFSNLGQDILSKMSPNDWKEI